MNGKIEVLRPTYGFIRGDDGVSRFFIPSLLEDPIAFDTLQVGQLVTFEHEDAPKGPRAALVVPFAMDEEVDNV